MTLTAERHDTALPENAGVFERTDFPTDTAHEQVTFFQDPATGLKAIVAIHDTTLGPALGGTRFYRTPTRPPPSRTCCACRGGA